MNNIRNIFPIYRLGLAYAMLVLAMPMGASANTEMQNGFEAVALIEVVQGYSTKYNLGLPYSTITDCQDAISKIGLAFNNLHLQGVFDTNKPIDILCEERIIFPLSSPKT